jgi:hypothetical protein
MILPRCIFPLISETTIHINASPMKNGVCDGRYNLRLAGLVQTIARKDIVNITISTIKVIVLNLRFSIYFFQQMLLHGEVNKNLVMLFRYDSIIMFMVA